MTQTGKNIETVKNDKKNNNYKIYFKNFYRKMRNKYNNKFCIAVSLKQKFAFSVTG